MVNMILKNFLYLNEPMLDSFLSSLEDGLRTSVEKKSGSTSTLGGKAGVAGVGASGETGHSDEERTTRADTPAAKFERLLRLARATPEDAGWIEVVNPDDDLDQVGTGAILDLEAELYIPEMIKALAPSGGIASAIDKMQGLLPFAKALNLNTGGLPPAEQLEAVKGLSGVMGNDLMFVADLDNSDKRIAGKLVSDHLKGDVEGYARVIGKVVTQWPEGNWKPLMALPGMNLVPRAKRRELERTTPTEEQKENYLEGPAFMLDVLAIYR